MFWSRSSYLVLFQGVKILKDIEKRLKGFEGNNRIMIPLSIEGQVHYLINVSNAIEACYEPPTAAGYLCGVFETKQSGQAR